MEKKQVPDRKKKKREKANLCYIDTDSLNVYIKTDNIYKDNAEFNTSHDELDTPLPKLKNKKAIELMKDELGRKIMKKFVGLRSKTQLFNRKQ